MKWSLQQLHKFANQDLEFSGEYDFSDYIESIGDVYDISIAKVSGRAHHLYDDRFEFFLNIKVVLVLEDARTLDPVDFPLDLEVIEVFDINNEDDEDIRLIEKNTIDLKDIVWENIILEKPIRVVKEELDQ